MGFVDKIKNALFEVEYVEVDEPVKPEKKKKFKPEKKVEKKEEVKPIAKKVVLPGKKEAKIEELEEEELKDDNFEVRPKDETVKESHSEFKFMDDKDFKSDDYARAETDSEPGIIRNIDDTPRRESEKRRTRNNYNSKDRDSYNEYEASYNDESLNNKYTSNNNDRVKEKHEKSNYHESKPYGMDSNYKVPVPEYGIYEKKEEKAIFKPSPIISPIHGILDKNYKKEDVVQKKEIRLTSSYTRSNVSVDDIRNKALGVEDESKHKKIVNTTFEVDDDDEDLMVDLTDDKDKPQVKELTMGDALEYFQDLGLEYNVDYLDANNKRQTPKRADINHEEKEKVEKPKVSITDVLKKEEGHSEEKSSEKHENSEKKVKSDAKTTVIKDESGGKEEKDDDDDNLFDLIDSMYEEKGA